jgi:hypothetical protein
MENGVEALKLASGMLIFVLAITITISTFTMASQALNRIFALQDANEYVTVIGDDGEEHYLNYVDFKLDGGTREVGIETIIPSIYRAYKENYAIYFYNSDGSEFILYEYEKGQDKIQVNYIDLEKEVHTTPESAIESVNKLLYEPSDYHPNGLYQDLKDKIFTEKLGEYYMDDVLGETETAEVNKTKKRVIVYTQK